MLKDYLEQRHISLASGRSSIALEREYWKALETLAYEDGWHTAYKCMLRRYRLFPIIQRFRLRINLLLL